MSDLLSCHGEVQSCKAFLGTPWPRQGSIQSVGELRILLLVSKADTGFSAGSLNTQEALSKRSQSQLHGGRCPRGQGSTRITDYAAGTALEVMSSFLALEGQKQGGNLIVLLSKDAQKLEADSGQRPMCLRPRFSSN